MSTITFTADANKTVTVSGLASLSVTATSGDVELNYNNQTYELSSEATTIPIVPTVSVMTASSEADTYTVQFTDGGNMKSVTDGTTEHTTFPASYTINTNTNFTVAGEDDKTITINYTGTTEPVVTDTTV